MVLICGLGMGLCEMGLVMDGFVCNDGDVCMLVEKCFVGECLGGVEVNCKDGNLCINIICVLIAGCEVMFNFVVCFDGIVCMVGDYCDLGKC